MDVPLMLIPNSIFCKSCKAFCWVFSSRHLSHTYILVPVQGLQLWLWTPAASSTQVSSTQVSSGARHTSITPACRQRCVTESTSLSCSVTGFAQRHSPAERRTAPGQDKNTMFLKTFLFFSINTKCSSFFFLKPFFISVALIKAHYVYWCSNGNDGEESPSASFISSLIFCFWDLSNLENKVKT